MRQITENAARAFLNRYSFKQSNTQVVATANEVLLYLHDNLIAKGGNGQLSITSAGWETNTTKERLNGLLSMINQPPNIPEGFCVVQGYRRTEDGV